MTIETTHCAFCGYQNCHPIELEPTKLFQQRAGFLCPNCGAMSVWGSSEDVTSDNVLGLRPVPPLFPAGSFYSPLEEPFFFHFAWPGFLPFWHEPFPSLLQDEDLKKLKGSAKQELKDNSAKEEPEPEDTSDTEPPFDVTPPEERVTTDPVPNSAAEIVEAEVANIERKEKETERNSAVKGEVCDEPEPEVIGIIHDDPGFPN